MIRSRIRRLRLEKEEREGRRLSNRVIAQETGLSEGVILRLSNSAFTKISTETIERLCLYFGCTVGELLEYVPAAMPQPTTASAPATAAATTTTAVAIHRREDS